MIKLKELKKEINNEPRYDCRNTFQFTNHDAVPGLFYLPGEYK